MSIRAGKYEFRDVDYDAEADVLYASLDGPQRGTGEETPELHVWRFNDAGRFSGITFISPRRLYERDGALWVTLPSGERVAVEGLEPILGLHQPA